MAKIKSVRRIFHASLAEAVPTVVAIVAYMAVTGETMQSSVLLKAMVAALGALIVVPGMRAMTIQCPASNKPFHLRPMHALMPYEKCKRCGFPEGDVAR